MGYVNNYFAFCYSRSNWECVFEIYFVQYASWSEINLQLVVMVYQTLFYQTTFKTECSLISKAKGTEFDTENRFAPENTF